jgi:hypothetical protein
MLMYELGINTLVVKQIIIRVIEIMEQWGHEHQREADSVNAGACGVFSELHMEGTDCWRIPNKPALEPKRENAKNFPRERMPKITICNDHVPIKTDSGNERDEREGERDEVGAKGGDFTGRFGGGGRRRSKWSAAGRSSFPPGPPHLSSGQGRRAAAGCQGACATRGTRRIEHRRARL